MHSILYEQEAMSKELNENFNTLKKKRRIDDEATVKLATETAELAHAEITRLQKSILELEEILRRKESERGRESHNNAAMRLAGLPKVVKIEAQELNQGTDNGSTSIADDACHSSSDSDDKEE